MGQRMRPTDGGPAARSRVSGAGTSVDDEIAAIERNGDGLSRVGPLGLFLAVVAGAAAVYLTFHRFRWYAQTDPQAVAAVVPIAIASIATRIGNHSFRATGITAYLKNGGTLEKAAQMANQGSFAGGGEILR